MGNFPPQCTASKLYAYKESAIRYAEHGEFYEKESVNGARIWQTYSQFLQAKETGSWKLLKIHQHDLKKIV